MTATRTASLYYRNGNSDKEYHVQLEERDSGFVVNFAYGRRGGTMSTGTKTKSPVDHAAAVKIFDKLVNEKQSKGYIFGEDGTPYQHPDNDRQPSGLLPQLLTVADDDTAAQLVSDPAWWMQQKMDGRRLILRKTADTVEAINKLGLVVGIAETVAAAARAIPGTFTIDGEIIGEHLHAFDLLHRDGDDMTALPYRDRYAALVDLLGGSAGTITAVGTWEGHADKTEQLAAFKADGAEGVVFKKADAPYTPGRPNSGGPQRKYKFVETLSAVVSAQNNQRSVGLTLTDGTDWKPVGNVTIPANHDVPPVGAVVEIRYLYAAPMLVQPVYLGQRDDVEPSECVTAQLKFKAE